MYLQCQCVLYFIKRDLVISNAASYSISSELSEVPLRAPEQVAV